MSPRRSLAAAACAAAVAPLLTACLPDDPSDFRDVNWPKVTGINLNCRHDDAQLVGAAHHHDITGEGDAEAFVTMRCGATGPGQMEVYRGGTDPTHPVRLWVIVHREEGYALDNCVFFNHARVIVWRRKDDRATQFEWKWDAAKRQPQIGSPTSVSTASAAGCP